MPSTVVDDTAISDDIRALQTKAEDPSTSPSRIHDSVPAAGDRIHVIRLGPATVIGPLPPRTSDGARRHRVRVDDGTEYKVLEDDMITKKRTESHPNLVFMTTPFESDSRKGATPSSVFNLVSTILGGGVLSLPYAVQSSGLLLGAIALVLSALASAFTIDLMIIASNRTGYAGYEDIGRGAYGRTAQLVTITLIGLLTWLAAIAYGVLIGDLLVPPVQLLGWHPGVWGRRLLIVCALSFISPLAFKRSLASLWFMGIVTVVSVGFTATAIAYTTVDEVMNPGNHTVYGLDPKGETVMHDMQSITLDFLPASGLDALSVFPVFGVSFLCHFNVLPMHTELRAPTVQRVRCVILTTFVLCTFIYFLVGYTGYAFASDYTCGNILLNYNPKSTLFAIVRVFMAGTLTCSYPLLILPCRSALNRLLFLCSATAEEEQDDADERLYETSLDPSSISFVGDAASMSRSRATSMLSPDDRSPSEPQPCAAGGVKINRGSLSDKTSITGSYVAGSYSLDKQLSSGGSLLEVGGDSYADPLLPDNDAEAGRVDRNGFEVTEEDIVLRPSLKQPVQQPRNPNMTSAVSYAQLSDFVSRPNQQTVYVYAAKESGDANDLQRVDVYSRNDGEGGSAKEISSQRLIALTMVIIVSTITVAAFLDAVMIIWTVMGATVAFTIAFILPTLFFRKLMSEATSVGSSAEHVGFGKIRRQAAGVILVFSILMSIVCTAVTAVQVAKGLPSCPT